MSQHPNASNDRPPKANENLSAQIARQNQIGQCLAEALQDLIAEPLDHSEVVGSTPASTSSDVRESDEDEKSTNSSFNDECDIASISADMTERILQTFGEAVANTNWDKEPAALVRGTLKHYTHMNQNWQITVQDVELRPREALGDRHPKRKRDRQSLWKSAEDRDGEPDQTVSVNGPLQLLAYDDI